MRSPNRRRRSERESSPSVRVRYPYSSALPGRRPGRLPRLYDGDLPEGESGIRPDRRATDGVRQKERVLQRNALDLLRQNPVRSGLIGLAVAGTAAPIVVHHHQQALRTDPSHEATGVLETAGADEGRVNSVWQDLESAEARAENEREEAIVSSIQEYDEYGLTRDLAEDIYDMAEANGIAPEVAYGLVRAESSFRNTSTSPVGAIGLTQLMPRTAAGVEPGVTQNQLREPETNLRIGFKYLRQLIDKYEGNTSLALLAYNRGPGTVDRELRSGRNPDNGYADFVYGREGHGHTLYTR